jgi:hypothetical protein
MFRQRYQKAIKRRDMSRAPKTTMAETSQETRKSSHHRFSIAPMMDAEPYLKN